MTVTPLPQLSTTDRMSMLARHVQTMHARGFRTVAEVDAFTVDMRALKPMPGQPNPIVHMLLLFATCGFWLIGWAVSHGVYYNQMKMWQLDPYAGLPYRVHVLPDGQPWIRQWVVPSAG